METIPQVHKTFFDAESKRRLPGAGPTDKVSIGVAVNWYASGSASLMVAEWWTILETPTERVECSTTYTVGWQQLGSSIRYRSLSFNRELLDRASPENQLEVEFNGKVTTLEIRLRNERLESLGFVQVVEALIDGRVWQRLAP